MESGHDTCAHFSDPSCTIPVKAVTEYIDATSVTHPTIPSGDWVGSSHDQSAMQMQIQLLLGVFLLTLGRLDAGVSKSGALP
jgi:hypothetical protein